MTEADEVAQAIYEEWQAFWPLTPAAAKQLAESQMPGESHMVIDNVADALLRFNKR